MSALPERHLGLPNDAAPTSPVQAAWTLYDVDQPALSQDLEARLARFVDESEIADIVADPRFWIPAIVPGETSAKICALEDDGRRILGVVTIEIRQTRLAVLLGPITLRRQPVRRHRIAFTTPAFAREIDGERQAEYLKHLLDDLARHMGSSDVLFFEAVPMESPLMQAAIGIPRPAFRAVSYGGAQPHWLANLPESFGVFTQGLGSQTRQSIRRYSRKFIKEVDENYAVKCFTTSDEISLFLDDAIRVSKETWQFKDFEAGIQNRQLWDRVLKAAARLGWFRSYILYASDRPVAFVLGFKYRARFLYWMVGFDPAWRELRVGNFLIVEIIRDLIESGCGATVFDFGATDNPLKQRIGNSNALEGYFYLFPRTLRGTTFALAVRTANGLTAFLKRMLAKREGEKAKN